MRSTATLFILLCALVAAAFSFLSDDGFSRLATLNRSLEQQQRTNSKLTEGVQSLKREVQGLQNDPRTVEKAARNELGMGRPGEMIVVFEKKDERGEVGHVQGR
ncbi:MAG: FtsB family cell division protein [Pseudomonadota bacterium]|jgi:cell division protein FtsB